MTPHRACSRAWQPAEIDAFIDAGRHFTMPIFHTAHLRVREDVVEQFRDRLLRHARISRDAEAGCHQFDIHEEAKDPSLFLLIEIYADEAAFELHRNSPHYLQFREDVKEWVIERNWWYWKLLGPVDQ